MAGYCNVVTAWIDHIKTSSADKNYERPKKEAKKRGHPTAAIC
jgi:hypothetical protein